MRISVPRLAESELAADGFAVAQCIVPSYNDIMPRISASPLIERPNKTRE
jgi:hypothetical protein